MYYGILNYISNLEVHLVVKTIGIIDYYRGYKNYSGEQIRQAISARGGDVSIGSTYIIDLKNNVIYRFRDHKRFMTRGDFIGFFHYKTGERLPESSAYKDIDKAKSYFIVRESIRGEIHESTPIEKISFVPSVVLHKAIRDKGIEDSINLWNLFFK